MSKNKKPQLRLEIQMPDVPSVVFKEATIRINAIYQQHKIIPSKGDFIDCYFEHYHRVEGLQYLLRHTGETLVTVWLEEDYDYNDKYYSEWKKVFTEEELLKHRV